jgi:hypothetical protein
MSDNNTYYLFEIPRKYRYLFGPKGYVINQIIPYDRFIWWSFSGNGMEVNFIQLRDSALAYCPFGKSGELSMLLTENGVEKRSFSVIGRKRDKYELSDGFSLSISKGYKYYYILNDTEGRSIFRLLSPVRPDREDIFDQPVKTVFKQPVYSDKYPEEIRKYLASVKRQRRSAGFFKILIYFIVAILSLPALIAALLHLLGM